MNRPTIVHMISSPVRGAPREIMLRLLELMDTSKYRPAAAFLREGTGEAAEFGLDSMRAEFDALDIPMIVCDMEQAWDVRGAHALDGFMRDVGADLICSHLNRADLWAAALGWWGRVPTVRVVHGLEPFRTARPPSPGYGARVLDKVLLERCAKVVCVSKESQRLVIEAQDIPRDKTVWIPGGIDIERFSQETQPFPTGSTPTFGMVTRLNDEKGVWEFVDAVAPIQREHDANAVVAGDGPSAGALRAHAGEVGAEIEWLGQVGDVPAVLERIDVFALPSYHEGTPLSVLEAMSAGRVVVCSDVGGLPHLITDHESGRIVPAKDAAALAGAFRDILADTDRALELAEAAKADAQQYSLESMVAAYDDLYVELVGT